MLLQYLFFLHFIPLPTSCSTT